MAASFSFITSAAPTSASMVADENGDWRGRRSKKMRSEVCVCVSAKEERRQEWIRKEGGVFG